MPSHVLSTYKELSILLVRLSFGLKQTKKAAREKFRINFYKKKIVNFFPNSMEKQGANCHNLVMSWYFYSPQMFEANLKPTLFFFLSSKTFRENQVYCAWACLGMLGHVWYEYLCINE